MSAKQMTVRELIARLNELDPDATVGVFCHGCCAHAHEINAVYAAPDPPAKPWHHDADVIIEV